MPLPQSGVCAEANLHGSYLFFNVLEGHDASLIRKLANILSLQERYEQDFSEALLNSMVAIGAQYWPHVYHAGIPKTLAGFPQFEHLEHAMPSRPIDLMVQIRSDRLDVIYLFQSDVLELLGQDVELVEQVNGFHYLDGRDLNGFRYDHHTPHGRHKTQVALVGEEDTLFAGGSYIHVQRYIHNLKEWQSLPTAEQEMVMGRVKETNQVLSMTPENAHANRVELKNTQGQSLYLNQGMPFADVRHQGFLFVCCAGNGYAFQTLLKHQLGYADDEGPDMWLEYSKSDFGAAFFAPSQSMLRAMSTQN